VIADVIKQQIGSALANREVVEHDIEKNATGDFNQRVGLFARLDNWRRQLEECLKFAKEQQDALAPSLLEDMGLNGIQNVSVEGLSVHQRRDFFCNKLSDKDGVSQAMICQALSDMGLGYMVSEGYNASALKSKVREWVDEGVEIPSPLKDMIKYGESVKLVATK
jgi:hypothetical protein